MINAYFSCSKNTIYQYIATCLILELCLAAEWRPGKTVPKRLWEQGRVYWEGVGEVGKETEEDGEEGKHYD